MASAKTLQQASGTRDRPRTNTAAPPLPDVNAETYPYEVVQKLLDEVANFNLVAIPHPGHADTATLTPGNPDDFFGIDGGYGLDIRSTLHGFDAPAQPSSAAARVTVAQTVGESVGIVRCRWL